MKRKTNISKIKARGERIRIEKSIAEVNKPFITRTYKQGTNITELEKEVPVALEAKKCPFCGSPATLEQPHGFRCKCSNTSCLLSKQLFFTEQWNLRINE